MNKKEIISKISDILCYISAVAIIVLGIAFWPFAILGVFALIFKIISSKSDKEKLEKLEEITNDPDYIKLTENKAYIEELNNQINALNANKEHIENDTAELSKIYDKERERLIDENNVAIAPLKEEIASLNNSIEKLNKKQITVQNKLNKYSEVLRSVNYSLDNFFNWEAPIAYCKVPTLLIGDMDSLSPTVTLNLHSMDIKDLRKAYRKNDKDIENLLSSYLSRYTTKTNRSIYQLMVISLRAELQNILISLKYEKLDTAIEKIKETTAKYLGIASEGNQSIVGTMTKFIGQIEYLFINAAKIEYNYYVKKEKAKQEQIALREQMRIEAQERKALEAEQRKVEAEESKFEAEIQKLKAQLESAAEEERNKLNAKITDLQAQLSDVVIKKDEIVKLQNGKAGNIYVISNLGSFGDDVFKIGMTRRIDPQERVNELGSASVPFKFDVHSFIFSDDAVGLESKLHNILNEKRVNKVNLRKEFFKLPINELQQIVEKVDPTAEFNKTMAAEEYRQSLSSDEIYTSDISSVLLEEDDE